MYNNSKRKYTGKILSILLAVAMVITMVPFSALVAYADDDVQNETPAEVTETTDAAADGASPEATENIDSATGEAPAEATEDTNVTSDEGNSDAAADEKLPFEDVADDDYFKEPVSWALHNGITSGVDDTHFGPAEKTTRAQMVTFLWRTVGSPEPSLRNLPFEDVREDSYFYKAVLWGAEKGIVNGVSENEFAPDESVTRAQAATYLYRLTTMGMDTLPESGDNPFSDVETGMYYTDAVVWANTNNITNGTGQGVFSPDSECQRAQIVTFLYRFIKSVIADQYVGDRHIEIEFGDYIFSIDIPDEIIRTIAICAVCKHSFYMDEVGRRVHERDYGHEPSLF